MASVSSLRCLLVSLFLCLWQLGVSAWSIPHDLESSGFLAGAFDAEGGSGLIRRDVSTISTTDDMTPSKVEAATTTTSSTYVFNATAKDITIAYYGQTNMTTNVTLTQLCAGLSVDIITLGFIDSFYASSGKENITLDFNGYLCSNPNSTQTAAGMSGLLDCVGDGFAAEIAACQKLGKKVLISAGGASADLAIPTAADATTLATTLWNLFLGGDGYKGKGVRPFGSVVLDGFDIDNENVTNAAHLYTLVSTLRNLTKKDTSKKYYFSAAPICAYPDPDIPVSTMLNQIDYWNVQFYNAQACQLGSGHAPAALKNWSTALLGARKLACSDCAVPQGLFNVNGNNVTYPRLLVGGRTFYAGEKNGYVNMSNYRTILESMKKLKLPNLSGAMFWDGAYMYKEKAVIDGKNRTFAQVAKDALID
ncbi:chitinase [Exophiala viscosa]|uniref:chitinase n=1 Tax=Exophiala viscosa TaxID=2486360 RepID=UPI002193C700|nr:chitinase [Exophiala viscosa]